ncbi:FAD-dependent oxidoreductase domain-containing protein 2 [Exaiptasia diaphana]|uniref:FAD-dependent oxidoreductase domain-containing protein 2 n=1 Tax=Exaiptasia diaphana TaxID=2652724 RepID=A0A913XA08_EXADI|nr:FAD-dependent oxidoreductase domain-containing protein 2 [Exaiptasia diaphana]KXJ26579.1 FAD-dependent oxidoreductase domain-containing protein 2 [Exaiptasia diaphana]
MSTANFVLIIFEFLFFIWCFVDHVVPQIHQNYCVVGAGPGGLQMGFFLQKAGRDYIIFERSGVAGSFYVKFPRHRKLISINKRHTGKPNKEFNLRHDWNSLISDDESLLVKHYSKEFFPKADDYVRYLNDFAKKLELKVQYNTDIKHISKQEDGQFYLKDSNGTEYSCKYLIMSTGIAVENIGRNFKGIEYTEKYSEISTNPDDYEGQSVLIVGRGNSAFETADSIMGATNLVHMISRSRIRMAWETHYVGDLRAINNGILDTYQLKSLDALLEAPIEQLAVVKKDNKLYVDAYDGDGSNAIPTRFKQSGQPDNFAIREPYDRIIRCLGFQFDFSIFDNATNPGRCQGTRVKKYPNIKPNYEASKVPNMYFSGTNTHSIDFRKSAGGFIHGFRYTTRALHYLLEWKNHGVVWPHVVVPYLDLMNIIIKRINEASDIYQMFGVLGDVAILRDDGQVAYFESFPVKLVNEFQKHTGYPEGPMIVLNMEYGKDFSGAGKDTFKSDRATGEPSEAHLSNFLHPVFYFYREPPKEMDIDGNKINLPRPDRIHHIVEDFITLWTAPESHLLPLRRFFEYVKNQDLRHFFAKSCFKMMMTHETIPESCQLHYLQNQGLPGTQMLFEAAQSLTVQL